MTQIRKDLKVKGQSIIEYICVAVVFATVGAGVFIVTGGRDGGGFTVNYRDDMLGRVLEDNYVSQEEAKLFDDIESDDWAKARAETPSHHKWDEDWEQESDRKYDDESKWMGSREWEREISEGLREGRGRRAGIQEAGEWQEAVSEVLDDAQEHDIESQWPAGRQWDEAISKGSGLIEEIE